MEKRSGRFLRISRLFCACVLFASLSWNAAGEDEAEYNRRAAARYTDLFNALDRDRDGRVTLAEARGDIDFSARFDDMDIDRDGAVTAAELQRFISQYYGVTPNPVRP